MSVNTEPNDLGDSAAVSVVVPAFNEAGAITDTVREIADVLCSAKVEHEILVVDDGSSDDTASLAQHAGARVISTGINLGYGAALKLGVEQAAHDFIAILDADATYPASELPTMLRLCRTSDMVVGDRGAAMQNVPALRRPAKRVLNWLASFLAERRLNDINSGMRVFRKSELVPFIGLLPDGFSFTTTITLCMVCSGKRVVYTPISYGVRVGESKIKPRNFVDFIILLLRISTLFNPLRVFLPLGFVFFLAGTLKFTLDLLLWNLSETAVFLWLTAVIIWAVGLLADMVSRLHLRP